MMELSKIRMLEGEAAMQVARTLVPLLRATNAWKPVPSQRHVAYVIAEKEQLQITPQEGDHTIIILEEHAQVTIMETASNCGTYILLKNGATLKYYTSGAAQRFIYQQHASQVDWVDAATGQSESTMYLAEDGAHAKFRSLFIAAGTEHYDVQVSMIHQGSHTTSNMLTRAALLDSSTGRYRGLIKILPDARSCDAHQREDTLLLGDHARMDAVPILEISNNEVKCSHGVTLGQVDEEQLFYLESRGLPRAMATDMIVQGFFDQLLISMGEYGGQLRNDLLRKVQHA